MTQPYLSDIHDLDGRQLPGLNMSALKKSKEIWYQHFVQSLGKNSQKEVCLHLVSFWNLGTMCDARTLPRGQSLQPSKNLCFCIFPQV